MDETRGQADRLQFGILGPLQARHDGAALQLGGRQQRAVLALLLAEAGSTVSVDRLADALWGQHVPAGYVGTLQTYVFHLRELLEPGRGRGAPGQVLLTRPSGYALGTGDGAVDATEFERLSNAGQAALARHDYTQASDLLGQALGLWRGEVLADLAGYEFVGPIAARLDELRLAALEARIDADLALGRHAALVAELDHLVDRHPLRERLHGQRMLALYRCGRQSDALAAYRDVHQKLDDELGIQPSAPLRELHRAILAQDDHLDLRPAGTSRDEAPLDTAAAGPAAQGRNRRRILAGAGVAALAAAGTITAVVATHRPTHSLAALPANSVGAIHSDGSLHDAVAVGQSPGGLAYGAGALWATNAADGTVSRIDPATHTVVQTIHQVGADPTAVTVSGQEVWVANGGDGTVSGISTVTTTVVDPAVRVGAQPAAIASGPGGVWVADSGDDTVQRIDPDSGTAGRPIRVGDGPDGIAVGAGAVWVANGADGTVSRLDATTGEQVGLVHVGAGAKGIAVTADAVWVANSLELTVSRIDPSTDRVVATVEVGDGPTSVVAEPKGVWVGNEYDGTVAKIDPDSNHVVRRIAVGSSPRALALAGSTVWLAVGAFTGSGHVGGTLTVASATSSLPGSLGIDPASADVTSTVQAETLVYGGLVGFRRTGGVAGLALVPDLARTLPRPTDGGLTYTFTLRPGIRYSTGALVQADIRRGVQRALTLAAEGAYYAHIEGGPNCRAHPPACDLSRGVVSDERTRRVTFHLTTPDPDFLAELTRFVYPTPQGTPMTKLKVPLPGTGPYMITGYRPGEKQFTLTRNPHFRQWSYAAQPAGYPDKIVWKHVPKLSTAVADVVAGRADLVSITNSTGDLHVAADLARKYPAQLHPASWFQTTFAVLNTAVAPFDDARVRKAVNYAVDRNKLVDILGGQILASATCQVLPPNFPGYQPYCPYTTPSADGGYHGPDLATARRLVAASGTNGTPVTVVGPGINPAYDAYFVTLLNKLGYRATLREFPDFASYADYVYDSRKHVQIAAYLYWATDFPSPSNSFAGLSCQAFVPANSAANSNLGAYCNPQLDLLARHALAAQTTDPTGSRRLWAQVDRMVTDDAAVVATVNGKIENFVSTRVGNFQSNPQLGPLFDQMWVQ
jgi:YVTN family beta-propeller protein